ncbi:hypothetical protein ERW51_16830, partial [Aliivibrio finisterrensis]
GFLQTPPLASDALAIQIVFPLVGVTLLSCKQTGLPALLGKQKMGAHCELPLVYLYPSYTILDK